MSDIDLLCVNAIRCFAADTVQQANSGHPGAPMGMAPMAHVLWSKIMNYSSSNPHWYNRDRFVLSNGHACALLYTLLHLTGYESFPLDQIKLFRQLGSNTPGHPECHVPGVEVSTGPLGQGIANAVGMAIAEANLAATYNKEGFEIFNNFTYVFCGDGCLMEGISAEAASLAGHLGLGKLVVLYDDNKISIDGETSLSFTEDVPKRFEAYGWHVSTVQNGDSDFDGIFKAIEEAKSVTDKPSLISVKTTIGFGSGKQGTEKVHGSPLGGDDIAAVKRLFGFDPLIQYFVPEEVRNFYSTLSLLGGEKEKAWNSLFAAYESKYPAEAAEIKRRFDRKLPDNWKSELPTYAPGSAAVATRKNSQQVLSKLIKVFPELIGGSADLAPSNLTLYDGFVDFQKGQYHGRNIRFGVREHAMAAIVNGLFAYGGFIPYAATFFNFLSYCQGAVTLSDLSSVHGIYIMTHDSIGLGEDGPTHQPIEKFATVRGMPNILLFRPADGNETSGSYAVALEDNHRPSVLALSRQDLPQLEGSSLEKVKQGGYVLQDPEGKADVILVATGSEVSIAVKSAELLASQGKKARVVSFPCTTLFDEQSKEYQLSVLPDGVPVLSIEAASTFGWSKYAHAHVGLTTAGASGKATELYKHFGITPEAISAKALKLMEFYAGSPPRSPVNVITWLSNFLDPEDETLYSDGFM